LAFTSFFDVVSAFPASPTANELGWFALTMGYPIFLFVDVFWLLETIGVLVTSGVPNVGLKVPI
jgi:hypothetical protein